MYANYSRMSLSQGMSDVVNGYLGGFANMFAVKTSIRFPYAPFSFLVDLNTMEVLLTGQVSVDQAISACKALPE